MVPPGKCSTKVMEKMKMNKAFAVGILISSSFSLGHIKAVGKRCCEAESNFRADVYQAAEFGLYALGSGRHHRLLRRKVDAHTST